MDTQFSFRQWFWFGVIFLVVMYLYPDAAHAADPSGKAGNFVSGIYEFLTGRWTVSVVSIALIVAGFMTFRGMIPTMYLISVASGVFLIYASFIIAQWMYGLST